MPAIDSMAQFNIQKPVKKIMPNGIVLNILETGQEDVIRLDVVIECGQLNQKYPLQAMMTNRMLREGTKSMTSAQIAEKLDFYGAWLDLSSSVDYGFITLYSLGKFFAHTVNVLAEMLMSPVFPNRELEIVTEANKQMFMVNSQRVEVMARKRLNIELFGKEHPLGRFAEIEDYENLTKEMLQDFYNENYFSDNCTIFVAGKVTEDVLKHIEEHLGRNAWGRKTEKKAVLLPQPLGFKNKRVVIKKEDAIQCSVKMGAFMPDNKQSDYMELKVLNVMLGGYFGSRLMKNIREDKGFTYGICSGIVSYPENNLMIISTETANEYVEDVIREVKFEIDRIKHEIPGEDELNMVKNYMIGDICRAYENALSISDAWIYVLTNGVCEDFFEKSLDSIKNISGKKIVELAEKYLDWNKMVEIVAGNI